MKQIFLIALFLPLASIADSLPGGSYINSCTYCEMDADQTLHCECKDDRGSYQETHLVNAAGCEQIENLEGKLSGHKFRPEFIRVSPALFKDCQVTCDDAFVCKSLNIRVPQFSSYEECRFYDEERNVTFFKKGSPLGSYRETCIDCDMDANKALLCKCHDKNTFVETRLENADVYNWVKNQDGKLVGKRNQADVPKGSYLESCVDCQLDVTGALNCRCRSFFGKGVSPSRLVLDGEYRDIINSNGKLELLRFTLLSTFTEWAFQKVYTWTSKTSN